MAERIGRRSLGTRLRRFVRDAAPVMGLLGRYRRTRYHHNDAQGPRLRFYTMYDREAKAFDTRYTEACQANLSDVLLFAGLLSTVNSTLALQASSYAQRDPAAESADFLRGILYTLNRSILPDEGDPYVPPIWEGPSRSARIASDLLYASFLLAILASFLAMVAKQWLDWYLGNSAVSMTARCWERQRKRDGLDRWAFQTLVNGLPLLLQISLVLLGAGLIVFITTYTLTSAEVVITFTALGAAIYLAFTVPGVFSHNSPLRTSLSVYVRTLLGNILMPFPVLERKFASTKKKLSRWIQLSGIPRLLPVSMQDVDLYLGNFSTPNADDAHCVSWILKNITDPEAIDTALQLAGVVRWFENGCNSDPPYDTIVSTFESCFGFTGTLDKNLKERAYSSATAILQVHISALLNMPEEYTSKYPIPSVHIDTNEMDGDLRSVLDVLGSIDGEPSPSLSLANDPKCALWTSELLLWFVSNKRPNNAAYSSLIHRGDALHYPQWHEFPPEVVNNFLLVWCVHLGWKVDIKKLGSQKFDSTEEILEQLSTLVLEAISPSDPHHSYLPYLLNGLTEWRNRPPSLARTAFDWCTAICEEIEDDDQCASLIYLALRVGFRRFTSGSIQFGIDYVPADHQRMVKLVFKYGDLGAFADALCAWTSLGNYDYRVPLLGPCVEHLVELARAGTKFPPRLQWVTIRAISFIEEEFRRVDVERFVGLLTCLEVGVADIGTEAKDTWTSLILRIIESEAGREQLSLGYWELLVGLVGRFTGGLRRVLCDVEIIRSLEEKEDWEKLVCWLGAMWSMQPPSEDQPPVRGVTEATAALFLRVPTALQRLKAWIEGSVEGSFGRVHEDEFRRVCGPESDAARSESNPTISAGLSTDSQALDPTPPSRTPTHYPDSSADPPEAPDLPESFPFPPQAADEPQPPDPFDFDAQPQPTPPFDLGIDEF